MESSRIDVTGLKASLTPCTNDSASCNLVHTDKNQLTECRCALRLWGIQDALDACYPHEGHYSLFRLSSNDHESLRNSRYRCIVIMFTKR